MRKKHQVAIADLQSRVRDLEAAVRHQTSRTDNHVTVPTYKLRRRYVPGFNPSGGAINKPFPFAATNGHGELVATGNTLVQLRKNLDGRHAHGYILTECKEIP
jgi:hypothetical protein